MEPLPKKPLSRTVPGVCGQRNALAAGRRGSARFLLLLGGVTAPLLLCLVFLGGCVTVERPPLWIDGPPTGAPCHVVTTWKNQVYFAPDPTRNGEPSPGLVGRIYLFGKEVSYPIACQGAATVDLYDCTPVPGRGPVLLEQWRIDKDTLARLLHKDGIGWGYTLFLPWGTYRPDLRNIQLRLRFEQPAAYPIYAEICQVTLQDDSRPALAGMPSTPRTPAPPALPTLPAPRPVEMPPSQSFNLSRTPAPAMQGPIQPVGSFHP